MNTFSTITKNAFNFSEPINPCLYYSKNQSHQPIILSDFDGTISHQDVTDTLLEHFGMPGYEELEELWLANKISSKECMSKQIALMNTSLSQLNEALDTITIDSAFIDFIAYTKQHNVLVKIVSDGLDYAIEYILKRYGITNLPIYANHLLHDFKSSWRLSFPYANKNCVKDSGNCKCALVKQHNQITNSIIYIGDGASDFCVANKVGTVYAKNKLINYCQEKHIPYYPITGFGDVLNTLPNVLQSHSLQNLAITLTD